MDADQEDSLDGALELMRRVGSEHNGIGTSDPFRLIDAICPES